MYTVLTATEGLGKIIVLSNKNRITRLTFWRIWKSIPTMPR